ncbi:MAG: site-2 protease family protein [Pyrinomonadaceae bacterium]
MTKEENLELLYLERPVMRPSARTWARHILLLAITFCTATVAGLIYPFGHYPFLDNFDPQTFSDVLQLPVVYIAMLGDAIGRAFTSTPSELVYALEFSASLLFILISHEMGHYVMCRRYHVDATLPFFIPTPPMVGPAGTFGAFIKILSPMPSRKAVFDIGVAGPIAGFIALIPIAVIGLMTMEPAASQAPGLGITFADPLFMKIGGSLVGHDPATSYGNSFYYAAWIGLLVTALNLIPSGQLDGGHAIYAVFGERVHRWTGRIAFPLMAGLSIVGLIVYGSPSGFLVAVILAVMMKIRHPQPWDMTPLDRNRKLVALLTLVIFVLCFVPFPIQIS